MKINTKRYFQKLWNLHINWGIGVLYKEIIKTTSSNIYLSEIPGEYYNFAVPTVKLPNSLNLIEIEKIFQGINQKSSFILFSSHQDEDFVDHLVRQGYKSSGGDCWLVLNKKSYKYSDISPKIMEITTNTFTDYYNVLSKVFIDFPGNEKYLDICFKTIRGDLKSNVDDLISKLYVIYEGSNPVSGGGIFYSKNKNFAYLHDGGTLKEYRGKGYQTALLKHRVNIALENNISTIYTSVEPMGQSWSNCIKVGFTQTPWSLILTK